ncbi:MAG: hypothetical protein U0797_25580 [Gemmataceae bacterium]
MSLVPFHPARRAALWRRGLAAVVGTGVLLLTVLMLAGLGRPGAAILIAMWLVGSAGLLAQGGIALLLMRGARRRRTRGREVTR